MVKVGLTGGIGTGKSVVAGIFSTLGVPVYYADQEAKKAYSNPLILEKVRTVLGAQIFDGQDIDFSKLSNHIFANKFELEKLNNIIHPFVLKMFKNWVEENRGAVYIIMESAILYETGNDLIFDLMIVVDAPIEVCIERVMKRDNFDRNIVLKRMSNQFLNQTKSGKADFIINNDDTEAISPLVIGLHKLLLSSQKK